MLTMCMKCVMAAVMVLLLVICGGVIKICSDLISDQKRREENKDYEKYKDVRIEPDSEHGGYRIVLIPAEQTQPEEGK